jgi:hypothetical protein
VYYVLLVSHPILIISFVLFRPLLPQEFPIVKRKRQNVLSAGKLVTWNQRVLLFLPPHLPYLVKRKNKE